MQRDDAKLIRLLKTAGGQIEGIIRMIEDKKYCIDVSNQIMAAQAILSRVNKEVLNAHLHSCVLASIESGDAEEKVEEIAAVLDKFLTASFGDLLCQSPVPQCGHVRFSTLPFAEGAFSRISSK